MALSSKHQHFVNEYLKCWNGTQAYLAAYPNVTYETASVNASDLLRNTKVSSAIQARIEENAMSANEVLHRLARHGRATLEDFITVNENGWKVDLHKAQQSGKLDILKKITRTEKTITVKDREETTVTTAIELHDVQNALTLLGKNLGVFSDQLKLINELERALDLLEDNLDNDTFKRVLSILSTGNVGGSAAAKNREERSEGQAES